jgi:ABC-type transport system substrate-binding protein
MTSSKYFRITSLIAVAAGAALFASTALGALPQPALGARSQPTLSLVLHNRGLEFVTSSGATTVYPGHLQVGDRILARDALTQGKRSVGYDDELCTVTVDNHELCQDTVVLPGKGQIEANWLWTDWPSGFTGAIDGGTGTFAHAKGEFTATPLAGGALKLTATFD